MKKIYYYFSEQGFSCQDEILNPEDSILSDDRFSYNITSVYSETDKNFSYYKCPAWSHKAKRTFIIRSPIDLIFHFKFGDDGKAFINSNRLNQQSYDTIVGPTFNNPNWHLTNPNRIVMQLAAPHLLFWTNEKNIWLEQKSYSKTSLKNNFDLVGGWFNISSWTRALSFAINICDVKKPLVIKRGDPIYEVCFYSKNLDDRFKLIKSPPPDDLKKKMKRNISLKDLNPKMSTQFMFGQQEKESKCPFSFLWKN